MHELKSIFHENVEQLLLHHGAWCVTQIYWKNYVLKKFKPMHSTCFPCAISATFFINCVNAKYYCHVHIEQLIFITNITFIYANQTWSSVLTHMCLCNLHSTFNFGWFWEILVGLLAVQSWLWHQGYHLTKEQSIWNRMSNADCINTFMSIIIIIVIAPRSTSIAVQNESIHTKKTSHNTKNKQRSRSFNNVHLFKRHLFGLCFVLAARWKLCWQNSSVV